MNIQKYVAFIFIMLFAHSGKGQQLLFNNMSTQVGLPAQECYNVMQDSKGYIWISTEAGLCRYNGNTSKVFDKKNGLPENACYAVTEDKRGNVWMVTSANRVLRYQGDSLVEASFSKSFSEKNYNGLMQGYRLSFRNDSAIINTQNATYIAGINSTKTSRITWEAEYYSFVKEGEVLRSINSFSERPWVNKTADEVTIEIKIKTGNETKRLVVKYANKHRPNWRVLTAYNGEGENFIAFDHVVVKVNADFSYSVYEMPNEVLSLYCDKARGLWVGILKGGVRYYENTRAMTSEITSLDGFSVTGVCVDGEDGVWCTTLEKGIFYSRNKNVINYANAPGLDKPVNLLKCEAGKVFSASGNNELIQLTANGVIRYELKSIGNRIVSDILKTENGWMLSGNTIVMKTDDHFGNAELIKFGRTGFNGGVNQMAFVQNNTRLFGIDYAEIVEITNEKIFDILWLNSGGKYLLALDSNSLLYGCKNGLYRMFLDPTQDKGAYLSQKINGIDGTVNHIFRSSNNDIWVTTREDGLFIYKGDSAINMTSVLKLPTERIFDITEDRFGTIWMGTNVGLVCFSRSNGGYTTRVYNVSNGLPSNEIFMVAADSNFIYFSSSEGVSRFPLAAELANKTTPAIYIHSLKINGTFSDIKLPLHLPYNKNSITLEFDVLTFKQNNAFNLLYRLKALNGQNSKEELITGSSITIDNLPPGVYEATVYAVNNDGVRSKNPVVLHFEIGRPFWQRAWFIASAIVFLGLFFFLVFKLIARRIRKKEEAKTQMERQLAEFQLTALQAQMNPHFLFNAINSIQNFILKKEEREAYDYLSKFSKLIRMVLNNSEQKTLTLQEELETIKLYVELEQLRFDKKFEFSLEIADDVHADDENIPTMLIQPYIENAIWHGLMNLEAEQDGLLRISISRWNSLLKIVVEDNGIGREQAGKYRRESVHRPVAMKLTEKRLSVINMMEDYAGVKVVVSDLTNALGKASGTRVEIYLS